MLLRNIVVYDSNKVWQSRTVNITCNLTDVVKECMNAPVMTHPRRETKFYRPDNRIGNIHIACNCVAASHAWNFAAGGQHSLLCTDYTISMQRQILPFVAIDSVQFLVAKDHMILKIKDD